MDQFLARPPDHDAAAPPLRVEDVTVQIEGVSALEAVTFEILSGQALAVVGPNGAGKTTLFNVIVGVVHPTSGSVKVYGHKPLGHVCIAYVPQRSQVDWSFPATVKDVVMMGRVRKIGLFRWPRKQDWEIVHHALERVGMVDKGDRRIGALSSGQQQRVFLAQSLAQGAEILLLDEPLTGLDVPSQNAIFRILEDLKEKGVTLLVATHDLNMAAERFDRVMLLNRRLIAVGAPQEVLSSEYLRQTYGEHMHQLPEMEGMVVLTDTCCEGEEHGPHA